MDFVTGANEQLRNAFTGLKCSFATREQIPGRRNANNIHLRSDASRQRQRQSNALVLVTRSSLRDDTNQLQSVVHAGRFAVLPPIQAEVSARGVFSAFHWFSGRMPGVRQVVP